MSGLTISKVINASPERVFAAISDFPNLAENVEGITQVEMLTSEPVGVGTRFKETRIMFNKEATEEMEVTEFEAPHHYVLEAESCGAHYRTKVEVAPRPEGSQVTSQVTMTTEVTPLTLMAKLMSPLAFLMKGMMKKCLQQDLDSIQDRLESAPQVG